MSTGNVFDTARTIDLHFLNYIVFFANLNYISLKCVILDYVDG